MSNESFLAVMITSMIALFFGFVLVTGGYRFFLVLLPIFGFFYGFALGAQWIQGLFGEAFLATVSSWLVGFLFAVVCALLSYLFYFFGIGIVAFALGYTLGVGVLEAVGLDFGFIVWLVGVVLGGLVVLVTFMFNIQKYIVIAATSVLGSAVIVGTFLYLFGGLPSAQFVQNPVRVALQSSPLWLIAFIILAALGAVAQVVSTRVWEVEMTQGLTGMEAQPAGGQNPPAGQPMPS
jgi:hypothetical protein